MKDFYSWANTAHNYNATISIAQDGSAKVEALVHGDCGYAQNFTAWFDTATNRFDDIEVESVNSLEVAKRESRNRKIETNIVANAIENLAAEVINLIAAGEVKYSKNDTLNYLLASWYRSN